MSKEDNDDLEDDNYYPGFEEDISLGPNEFDIPEEPLDDLGCRLFADG